MDAIDRDGLIRRYEKRLARFGVAPQALGWTRPALQRRRFAALAEPIIAQRSASVLDVGCGFGDLVDYLRQQGWSGAYSGVDIVPAFVAEAKRQHPDCDFRELDISATGEEALRYDYVVGSGLFNGRMSTTEQMPYVRGTLENMARAARRGVFVDFLSTWVNVQNPDNWYMDPAGALSIARAITRRIALRHDYMPYEFALYLFLAGEVTEESTFASE